MNIVPSICFVCLGNICRSPMAEMITRKLVADRGLADAVELSSAGTGSWHVGEPIDERAAQTLERYGYPVHPHRARRFDPAWFDTTDLVIAADDDNYRVLLELAGRRHRSKVRRLREFDPEANGDLDVPDPYYGGPRGFDTVFSIIERSCRTLVDMLVQHSAPEPQALAGDEQTA